MKRIMALTAAAAMLALTSCGIENPIVIVNDSEYIELAAGQVTQLSTDISVGNIGISYGDTENAKVHVDYKIQGITQNKVSAVSEHLACKAEIADDVLVVSIIDNETGKSFWEWKNSNAKAVEVEANVDIELPESFDTFGVNADVGNVEINGLSGAFDVKCDVGNLEMKDVGILADSEMSVDVGNCSISLAAVDECEAKVSVDVGDIDLDTGDYTYELTSGDDDKPVGGKQEIVVGGKCTMKLECDVGSIDLEQQEDKNV
ncbi:MAG: hypothetical protein Q4A05_08095 [Ruminococcus sp.]|nr:hypothetical protein [Ruminococcus sp.]